jgi:hypothetical protein
LVIRTWAFPIVNVVHVLGVAAVVGAVATGRLLPGSQPVTHAAVQPETVETDPIQCWWRTSAPAVRVGEPFSVVLTCSVVETDTVTVVPSQAELAPNAVQLPPFDVIGGSQGADQRTADHRFFQYEYRARLVSPELFGKDVPLPELRILYKVRTRVEGETLEGRDMSYVMPAASVRVLSLVPGDATDIRDASRETFTDIDRRLSRASLLRVSGGILMAFAALAVLVSASRLVSTGARKSTATRALASDSAILRQLGRELSGLQRARREADWTPALTSRLTTALRVLAGYALGRPAPAMAHSDVAGGSLTVRARGLRGDELAVPGWVTPTVIADALKRTEGRGPRAGVLQSLEASLARLTSAQYARDTAPDEAAIDEALMTGVGALRQMKIDNLWIVKKVHALRARVGLDRRA